MEANKMSIQSEYDWCINEIKRYNYRIDVLAEIGSRDGLDAIKVSNSFNSNINLIFEADPELIDGIKRNIQNFGNGKNFDLFNLAIGDRDGEVDFYSVNKSTYPNEGVGSLFKIDFNNRNQDDPDYKRVDVQKKIKISQNKYITLGLPTPDLLLIDVEGAEYNVLKGFEEELSKVQFIVLESSISKNHIGAETFLTIYKLLKKNFKLIKNSRYEKNYKLFIEGFKFKILRSKMYSPSFDLLFVNKSLTNLS